MGLEHKINNDIKSAMLSRDKEKLEALRAIKAALLLAKTAKDVTSGEIPESVEIQLLQKLVKQRAEAAEIYQTQGRKDLADVEIFQALIIKNYLPQQLSEKEIEAIIRGIIIQTGANSIKDMGKVMGFAAKELSGKADNKTVSEIVKQLLV